MIVEIIFGVIYWGGSILIGVITLLVIYTRWQYGTLERIKGLRGIAKPYFVGGSDPFLYKKVVYENDMKLTRQFGSVYGFYEGRKPQIYISDPELIKLIFVKDFEYFHTRRLFETGHEYVNEMMDTLPYNKWKVVRTHLSPSLTTGKIKGMSYQMLDCIAEWITRLNSSSNGSSESTRSSFEFSPKPAFMALTCDIIARCAFGTNINAFEDPNNKFMENLKKLVDDDVEVGFEITALTCFPFLAKIFPMIPKDVVDYFADLLKSIIKARKETNQRVNDFVDVLRDMEDLCDNPEYKSLNVTEATVMGQALFFLLAGFETTATTLTNLSFKLASHPEVQNKLLKEIDDYYARHEGKVEHETIGELPYLQACINETLRMHSVIVRIERVCQKNWRDEKSGLEIPKGIVVQVPVYAVHYNEEYFPEPTQFKPERFLPENKDKLNPYSFLSFGQGPHNCIGMRFAKEEIQLAMASILKQYYFEPTTDSKLKPLPGRTLLNNYKPFTLKLCRRDK